MSDPEKEKLPCDDNRSFGKSSINDADGVASHRQIVRDSTVIGGASIANIVIGLVRSKVAALLLGPSGLGLIALLLNAVTTGAVIAGLGTFQPAVREIADANGRDDPAAIARARRAIFWTTTLLALLGAVVFWLFRKAIARDVLDNPNLAPSLGWLALAVALTVITTSQMALLYGYRRIRDIAIVQVLSAFVGTITGVVVLLAWHENGIIAYIVAAPASAVLVGIWAMTRLPRYGSVFTPPNEQRRIAGIGWAMVRLGISFMLAGFAQTVGLLAVRIIIMQHIGSSALGNFSAAWMISTTYVGLVLQAVGADYLPRLTPVLQDRARTNRMVNEQAEIVLIMAAPILIGVQAATPWLVYLLYSSDFVGTVNVLRWQILGDVLKIACWPLGMVLVAAQRGKTFFVIEAISIIIFIALTWILIDRLGIASTGISFAVAYAIYLPIVYRSVARATGFKWAYRSLVTIGGVFIAVMSIQISSYFSEVVALILGGLLATVSCLYTVMRLHQMQALPSSIEKLLIKFGLDIEKYFNSGVISRDKT